MSLRLHGLRANNYKILKLVDIKFDKNNNLVLFSGSNKQGKSTVLDAIWVALGGNRELPEEPIRKGKEKAEIELELDEFIVKRIIKGTSSSDNKLVVTDKEGNRVNTPQTLLDSLMTKIGLRPRKFAEEDKDTQVEMLMDVVNFKFNDEELKELTDGEINRLIGNNPIEKIDYVEDELVQRRRDVNRDLKKVKSTYENYEDVEEVKEVNVSELVEERDKLQKENQEIENLKDEINEDAETITELQEEADDIAEKIRKLKEKLKNTKEKIKKVEKERDKKADKLRNKEKMFDENKERIEEINKQIKEANEQNKNAQKYKEKLEYKEKLDKLQETSDNYTEKIETVRDYKDKVMEESVFPIEGLSFKNGEVYYQGIPFDQASKTEKLEVGFAVMKANKPDLRVVLIDNGRTIDEEHMEFIKNLAKDDDYLVLMEYMDESEEVGIVIEDGEVKENNYEQESMFEDDFFDQELE